MSTSPRRQYRCSDMAHPPHHIRAEASVRPARQTYKILLRTGRGKRDRVAFLGDRLLSLASDVTVDSGLPMKALEGIRGLATRTRGEARRQQPPSRILPTESPARPPN